MEDELLKILSEIDSITRDEFAENRISYMAYIKITEKLSVLNQKIKAWKE